MSYPGSWNDEIYQGATWTRVITWYQADGVTPVDLTGYSGDMQLRRQPGSPIALEFSTTGAGMALGGMAGTITLTADDEATAALAPGVYYFDLFLRSAGDVETPLLSGQITVRGRVTQ